MVDWAMRYGNPSVKSVLDRLVDAGCSRLLLMALYPQYAAPTTATAYDKAFDALKEMRWQPALRTMGPYHDHPRYIAALADSIRPHLAGLDWEPGPASCSPTTACPSACCSAATPIIATARRRRGWCARSWAGRPSG